MTTIFSVIDMDLILSSTLNYLHDLKVYFSNTLFRHGSGNLCVLFIYYMPGSLLVLYVHYFTQLSDLLGVEYNLHYLGWEPESQRH